MQAELNEANIRKMGPLLEDSRANRRFSQEVRGYIKAGKVEFARTKCAEEVRAPCFPLWCIHAPCFSQGEIHILHCPRMPAVLCWKRLTRAFSMETCVMQLWCTFHFISCPVS